MVNLMWKMIHVNDKKINESQKLEIILRNLNVFTKNIMSQVTQFIQKQPFPGVFQNRCS